MIRLIDGYVIEPGPCDYMLAKDTGRMSKKGRVLKPISYHASVGKAILALREHCTRKSLGEKDMSLCEALSVIKQCDEKFEKLLKEAMREEGK